MVEKKLATLPKQDRNTGKQDRIEITNERNLRGDITR